MPNVTVHNEEVFLLSAIEKDELASLGKLYDNYSSILYGVSFRILNNEALAEKVLAKVFLSSRSKGGSSSTDSGPYFNCLFKSCRQIAFDTLKEQQAKIPTPQNDVYDSTSTAFELLYYKGLNYSQAATALNKTVEEVKADVRGAISNLKTKEKI